MKQDYLLTCIAENSWWPTGTPAIYSLYWAYSATPKIRIKFRFQKITYTSIYSKFFIYVKSNLFNLLISYTDNSLSFLKYVLHFSV